MLDPIGDLMDSVCKETQLTDAVKTSHAHKLRIHLYEPFVKAMHEQHPNFFTGLGFEETLSNLFKKVITQMFARQKAKPSIFGEKA